MCIFNSQELRFRVDRKFFQKLREELSVAVDVTDYQVIQQALTILAYAIDEKKRGRVLLSVEPDGSNPERLRMSLLESVRKHKV